jgi:xanthosine utilization system XapX-like protein
MVTMSIYLVVLLAAVWIVKHAHPHGWLLYTISLVPALPLLAMLGALGIYLTEEKDEYLRLITMRSLLVGTAVLLAMLVVDEVLRSISGAGALPPFTSWVTFFMAFGVAQAVQRMRNRVRDDA